MTLRDQRVIFDRELAAIYDVSTGRLNEAVKRNAERFPADFMFQITPRQTTPGDYRRRIATRRLPSLRSLRHKHA